MNKPCDTMWIQTLSPFQSRVKRLAEDYNLIALQPRRTGSSVVQAHIAADYLRRGRSVLHISANSYEDVVPSFCVLSDTCDPVYTQDAVTFRRGDSPSCFVRFLNADAAGYKYAGYDYDVVLVDHPQHISTEVWRAQVAPLLVAGDVRVLLFATGSVQPRPDSALTSALLSGQFRIVWADLTEGSFSTVQNAPHPSASLFDVVRESSDTGDQDAQDEDEVEDEVGAPAKKSIDSLWGFLGA